MGYYVPSIDEDKHKMLDYIGKKNIDELFNSIPDEIKLNHELDMPKGMSEMEVLTFMGDMARRNKYFRTIFRGAGAYRHFIPSIVSHLAAKEEFVTAYTPYQPEISQGILQTMFEYQTMICDLTGMDASNASVYDGATAAGEAFLMCKDKKRSKALISETTNPFLMKVVETYCKMSHIELIKVPQKDGLTDINALKDLLGNEISCLYIQQPNYFGIVEDCELTATIAHDAGAKFIMGFNPIAMALFKTPAECGADIAVGEGQPLGLPLSFGGPYLGIMTCKQDMLRKLPGRIVGQTTDIDGRRAFVLTLQAREQHIRREKASSNICSNQAHCALTAAVYLAAMGPTELVAIANQCHSKATYASKKISAVKGFDLVFDKPFFHEFVTRCPIPVDEVMDKLESYDILGGQPLKGEYEGCILWCATERIIKEEIDKLADILSNLVLDDSVEVDA